MVGTGDGNAAYVFVRSGAVWYQQAKLTAADMAAGDHFGSSVSLSGDTALVGSFNATVGPHAGQGAAYVFVRSGSLWFQQAKLTASDGAAGDMFGQSVSLNGNTALAGAAFAGIGSNADQGAAYVFVRSDTSWSQQAKLTAGDGAAYAYLGGQVAVNGDTALAGAVGTDGNRGAGYMFTRSGSVWTQQTKLTAADRASGDYFGSGVALSRDTAVVGAHLDDIGSAMDQGSAYVFGRSGGAWFQADKLTASDGAAGDGLGNSVGVSVGRVVVGTWEKDSERGAAYVFLSGNDEIDGATVIGGLPYSGTEDTRIATVNGSDPVHSCGSVSQDSNTVWFRYVANFTGRLWVNTVGSDYDTVLTAYPGTTEPGAELACNNNFDDSLQSQMGFNVVSGQSYLIEVSAVAGEGGGNLVLNALRREWDFNADGHPDQLWQNGATGQVTVWFMGGAGGATRQSSTWVSSQILPDWKVVGLADLDGDGTQDLIWQHRTTRQVSVWYMGGAQGTTILRTAWISSGSVPGWHVVAVADFNSDGHPDLVWQNDTTGQVSAWYLGGADGNVGLSSGWLSSQALPDWEVVAAADFDGNGKPDLVWQSESTRQVSVWYMQDAAVLRSGWLSSRALTGWRVAGAADLDQNGKPDLIWQYDTNQQTSVWYVGGAQGNVFLGSTWLAASGVNGWLVVAP